jgi:hypothetical protein
MMRPEVYEQLSQENSELHRNVLPYAKRRLEYSERFWSQSHEPWRDAERLYRAFREPDESDIKTRRQSLTKGVQKIVVPQTFAQIQSILAWMITVFLQRKPIVPVEGVGPNDAVAAMLHENVLEYQFDRMEPAGELLLLQWFLDSEIYGVGIIKNAFTVREFPHLQLIDGDLVETDVTVYEGNEAINVQPFDFYPDPRQPIGNFQRGEYCGHRMRRSHTELLQKQAQGLFAGVQFIPKHQDSTGSEQGSRGASYGDTELGRTLQMSRFETGAIDEYDKPYVDTHELCCYITEPERLGLPNTASSATPRLWVLTVANRQRVIRAEAANLPALRFPFEIIEMNYNLHSPRNPGVVELIRDLQNHQSWLFNARMRSVRKSLNNETLIDPSLIEEADLAEPNESGFIRLNKSAYMAGIPLAEVARPFPVNDVTVRHMEDAQLTQVIIEQITGANRLIQGLSNTGRRSATETQGQLSLAAGRMGVFALIAAVQGLRPYANQMVLNNQAFLSEQFAMRLRPPYNKVLGQDSVVIFPELLRGLFRFPFLQGGMPTDRFFEANMWREILGMGMQSGLALPTIQSISFQEVFARLLMSMNVKNIDDFFAGGRFPAATADAMARLQGRLGPVDAEQRVLPDDQVQNQVRQGNLVPSDGFPLPQSNATPGVGANGQGGAGVPYFG